MAFRNYKKTKSLCIEKNTPTELDLAVDEIQDKYDIIDLQFSTHFDVIWKEARYCAFLLLSEKESK